MTILVLSLGLHSCDAPSARQQTGVQRTFSVIEPEVVRAIDEQGEARVVILLDGLAPRAVDGDWTYAAERRIQSHFAARVGGSLAVRRRFQHVHAITARVRRADLDALRSAPYVRNVGLDEPGEGHLLESLPLAGFVPAASGGRAGLGITVAVLDTGVDRMHPDLANAVVDEACFCTGCCAGGVDELLGPGSAADDNGHGTHVAGIVASRGTVAPAGGAPQSEIIAVKVLDQNTGLVALSDGVAALDWLLSAHPEVDVVNLSWGTGNLFPDDCDHANASISAMTSVVQALAENGTIVVASSGNNGNSTSIAAPSCIGAIVSVGAVWDEDVGPESILCQEAMTAPDRIACFSNASATLDVLAPGARVTSTWPSASSRGRVGTSAAAPIVSACAALLREQAPSATVQELTAALVTSPAMLTDDRNGLTFPRLNCHAAQLALDSGAIDAGAIDAGAIDAGAIDAGAIDSGALDASANPDASVLPDAGALDGSSALPEAAIGPVDASGASHPDAALEAGAIDAGELGDATVVLDSGSVVATPPIHEAGSPDQHDAELTPPFRPPHSMDCGCAALGAPRAQPKGALPGLIALTCLLVRVRRTLKRQRARATLSSFS